MVSYELLLSCNQFDFSKNGIFLKKCGKNFYFAGKSLKSNTNSILFFNSGIIVCMCLKSGINKTLKSRKKQIKKGLK